MRVLFSALVFAPVFGLIVGCVHSAQAPAVSKTECVQMRAAFDVGSATTRMTVAEVDTCKQTLLKVLRKEERPVGYKEDLEKSASKEFSSDLQEKGLAAFSELSKVGRELGVTQFAGTATSAFRSAKNSDAYLARVKEKTGVIIRLIEQKTEAELGYIAATSEADVRSAVVWDIGGGSMQFSARDQDAFVTSLVELGSVGFKNQVLKLIRPKADLNSSPNPVGVKNFEKIVSLAKKHAQKNTTASMRELLKSRAVIGIGGVHSYSILKQAKQEQTYTQAQVEAALKERLSFTDAQVGGAYAATDVTNLALVYGYMKALDIKSVRAVNVNLTSGTLLYPKFW